MRAELSCTRCSKRTQRAVKYSGFTGSKEFPADSRARRMAQPTVFNSGESKIRDTRGTDGNVRVILETRKYLRVMYLTSLPVKYYYLIYQSNSNQRVSLRTSQSSTTFLYQPITKIKTEINTTIIRNRSNPRSNNYEPKRRAE